MSPVNFAFAKHDDGSASVSVGNIDRVYGMEWTLELVLRPKSTLLEQRVTLSNRSDVRRWASLAARKLPDFNQTQWYERLQLSLVEAAMRSETSAYPSWWMYNAGLLEKELGRPEEADIMFHKALLLPDRMLAYHFTRLVKTETTP